VQSKQKSQPEDIVTIFNSAVTVSQNCHLLFQE
jgi:hypothetical protein